MAGVQNTPEQKFKDFVLTSLVDMEPATFLKMKDMVLDEDAYPKGMTPLTKEKVEPCNKRLLMELITETYPLDQSKKLIAKLYKRLKVDAVYEEK